MEEVLNIENLLTGLNSLRILNESIKLRDEVSKVLLPILKSKYGNTAKFDINSDKDFLIINRVYDVVSPVNFKDPSSEISLTDERLDPSFGFEEGEEYFEEIPLSDFSSSEIMSIKRILNNRIEKLLLEQLEERYSKYLNKVIKLKVIKSNKSGFTLINDSNDEFFLPIENKIPKELIPLNGSIYCLVTEIGMVNIVTRRSPEFMVGLFNELSDELVDGTVINVARKPGIQTKLTISCSPKDKLFDNIKLLSAYMSSEVNLETVDIILYSNNETTYLKNLFYNAWLIDAWVDEFGNLLIDKNQVPYVVGIHGTNIKLSESLLGKKIQLHISKLDRNMDIELTEYSDEISKDLIDKLEGINITTSRELMKSDKMRLPKFINKKQLMKLVDLIHEEFTNE